MNDDKTRSLGSTYNNSSAENSHTIVSRIVSKALERPNEIAISDDQGSLDYQKLNLYSNELATHLIEMGIKRGNDVGLYGKRSAAFAVGALGILKAGSSYVPLDSRYPSQRICQLMEDADIQVVVIAGNEQWEEEGAGVQTIEIGRDGKIHGEVGKSSLCTEIQPDDLCYVIYTSGSTGKPKGVEIAHRNLMNLVDWHMEAFGVSSQDRASLVSSVGFDASVWEMWPYLAAGASLHVADDLIARDPEALRDWIIKEQITIGFFPTPIAERLMVLPWRAESKLRMMLTGGDVLHRFPPSGLPFHVINNYGLAECCVVSTSGQVFPQKNGQTLPSIGVPIRNTSIYVVDEELNRIQDGEEGEICIGGAGVGIGYRNQPSLTTERYLVDPFAQGKEVRIYRTGDRGRQLSNGQIEFLGRIDAQVKIRGQRIELAEIETYLIAHKKVKECAVALREFGLDDVRLVAYVVPFPEESPEAEDLQEYLARRLPEYMVPAVYVRIVALPLLINGKVDREKLPFPSAENIFERKNSADGGSVTEERVLNIMKQLLKVEKISRTDNFFILGGHSLLGTQAIARIRDAFGIDLSLRFLFENPTIHAVAGEVERLVRNRVELLSEDEAENLLKHMPEGRQDEMDWQRS